MTLNLDTLHLAHGGHDARKDGVCLLEAVAWWAGEDHTDHPECVSPILADFGISLNDQLDDARRQKLKAFIPLLPGTAGDGLDEQRGYEALDWLIRTNLPAWLDLAGLTAEAAELRGLRRIVDMAAAEAAGPVVRAARDAAGATAWPAAGGAVVASAWPAAVAAAVAAAGDAAVAAAKDAAKDAAADAATAAPWTALKPTARQLQESAIDLFARMIRPEVGGE